MAELGRAILVEVVYALPERQRLVIVALDPGATVARAIRESGLAEEFPEIDPGGRNPVGVFGRHCRLDDRVRDGDRVEIYRPLRADPREARRLRAAEGRTMAGRGLKRHPPEDSD